MADIFVRQETSAPGTGTHRAVWAAATAFALGDRVCSVTYPGRTYECTTAGTSGATEPVFNQTVGATTTDNTVVWTARFPSTWANALASLVFAPAAESAGDRILLEQGAVDSRNATIGFAGSPTLPTLLHPVTRTDEATGFTVPDDASNYWTVTGSGAGLAITGSIHARNMYWQIGVGGSGATLTLGSSTECRQLYENCIFNMANTSTSGNVATGSASLANAQQVYWRNVQVKFSSVGQGILVFAELFWDGGGRYETSGVTPTTLFKTIGGSNQAVNLQVDNVDFSGWANTMNLVAASSSLTLLADIAFRNCKMPEGWLPETRLVFGSLDTGFRAAMYNCSAGTRRIPLFISDFAGTISVPEDTYRVGGAPEAWLMRPLQTGARVSPLVSDPLRVWNDVVDTPVTVTVELLDCVDSLDSGNFWLEVDYPSGSDARTTVASSRTSTIATPAALAASTAQWRAPPRFASHVYSTNAYPLREFAFVEVAGTVFYVVGSGTLASGDPPAGYGSSGPGNLVVDGTAVVYHARRCKVQVTFTPTRPGFLTARLCNGALTGYVVVDPLLQVSS